MYMRCCLCDCRREQNQNGRWRERGEAVTQGRASVNMLSGMRAAHWVTSRRQRAHVPPPNYQKMHIMYINVQWNRFDFLKQAAGEKALRFIPHRFTRRFKQESELEVSHDYSDIFQK